MTKSSRAWLYGKLFVCLLTEKLINYAQAIPPGGITYPATKIRSLWSEFASCLHQIQEAIEPRLSLETIIEQWNIIADDLQERNRQRKPQIAKFQFF